MDEDTALKAAGCKSLGGSIPSASAIQRVPSRWQTWFEPTGYGLNCTGFDYSTLYKQRGKHNGTATAWKAAPRQFGAQVRILFSLQIYFMFNEIISIISLLVKHMVAVVFNGLARQVVVLVVAVRIRSVTQILSHSSVWLERLPDTQNVGGSNPSATTRLSYTQNKNYSLVIQTNVIELRCEVLGYAHIVTWPTGLGTTLIPWKRKLISRFDSYRHNVQTVTNSQTRKQPLVKLEMHRIGPCWCTEASLYLVQSQWLLKTLVQIQSPVLMGLQLSWFIFWPLA